MSTDHLTDRELAEVVDFVTGMLPGERASAILRRAATEERFASTIDHVRRLIESLAGSAGDGVPPGLCERLKAIYDPSGVAGPGLDRGWAAIVADLVMDSREIETLQGFRGAATAYQLSFGAGEIEVHLQVTPGDEDDARVMGQVEPAPGDNARFELLSLVGGEVILAGSCDEHGYFSFDIGAGTYDLVIVLPAGRVVIGAVEIG